MLTVAIAASLAVLLAGGAALPPSGPLAVVRVPEEPGALVLPDDEPTLQAVAVDLDGDGAPELVRLTGTEAGPVWAEAWRHGAGGWALAAPPIAAVPGAGGQAELAYVGRPVRLLLRRADGGIRITLVRQPDFAEPEDPARCCLLVDDLVLAGDTLSLARVAEPGRIADSVHAIDLDGDGTDELLAAYSLSPLSDASTPTEARVYRWRDGAFGPPTVSRLPVGSGSTPFVLGDSDGMPGDEAAFISSPANSRLFRVSLGPDDSLVAEDSRLIASGAMAVPLSIRRRGVVIVGPGLGLAVVSWPRGRPIGALTGALPMENARLIGVVEIAGAPHLLAHRTDPPRSVRSPIPNAGALHVLALPDLEPIADDGIDPSAAAEAVAGGPLPSYAGPLPGGGPDGKAAAIVTGRLLPAPRLDDPAAPIGALPGGRPVGLVGRDRAWLAIHHAPLTVPRFDPAGGYLGPPIFDPASTVSVAPLVLVGRPEGNGGAYAPAIEGGIPLDDGDIGVSPSGLVAEVRAPPGSRVHLLGELAYDVVDESGELDVLVAPPVTVTTRRATRVTMTVATPAGHAYVSSWNMRIVDTPPRLSASTQTPLGSLSVVVAGMTTPHAQVDVAGRAVAVDADGRFDADVDLPPWPTAVAITARDAIGNEATLVVHGVGIFDYRALPWVPIAIVLVGGIGAALLLRVPRPHLEPRPVVDDAVLEEIDPADRV